MQRKHVLTPAFALAFVAVPLLARAQEAPREPLRVTEAELGPSESWGPKRDQRVVLESVKFRGFFGGEIDVAGVVRGRLQLDPNGLSELTALLAGWKTKTGKLDPGGRSNVRVEGIARDASGRRIEVTSVTLLPDDVPAFTERARPLVHDPARALALVDEALARAERFREPDLRAWARAEAESALDERRRTLEGADASARIELANGYRQVAQVTSKAIAVLGEVVGDPATGAADRERALGALGRELDAVEHHGRWIARAELKRELGFLLVTDAGGKERWVRRERVELEAAVAERRTARVSAGVLRGHMPGRYEEAARTGELLEGMNKAEVAQARGLGFPVSVERVTEARGDALLAWDRWDMTDGRSLFFENGELFRWRSPGR